MKLMDKAGPPEKPVESPKKEQFLGKLPKIPDNAFRIPSLKQIGIDEAKDCGELLYTGG